jgi:spoIIIJ-associated protein
MGSERSIEVTGDSIEDAIAKGLSQLGVGPADVIVEVLDEPSAAMFGQAARPARVRLQLMVLSRPPETPVTMSPVISPPPVVVPPRAQPENRGQEHGQERSGERRPARAERPDRAPRPERTEPREERAARPKARTDRPPRGERPSRPDRPARDERPRRPEPRPRDADGFDALEPEMDDSLPFVNEAQEIPEAELMEDAKVARVVLGTMLEQLDLRARIAVRRSAPDDQTGVAPYILDIMSSGNSNRLIGRRGETLSSLQYLTRLITSREVQHRVDVIVDVNSYKARRAQSLTTLALRMADEAISTKRTLVMEPMPPHERRIVHLALRDRPDVSTRSIGEGTARKVTIVPGETEAQ